MLDAIESLLSVEVKNQEGIIPLNDQEIVDIISLDFANGPWIAGGAALKWYQGIAVGLSDIDVFCSNKEQAQRTADRLLNNSTVKSTPKVQTDNAITIDVFSTEPGRENKFWKVQVIFCRYFESLQQVIDYFDITVCQVGTGGNEWILGKTTARDIREKNLRFTEPLRESSVKRLIKYSIYGYRPVPGTIEAIRANSITAWKFEPSADYQGEI